MSVSRALLEPLLARFGRATVRSAPTRYEILLVHLVYLGGLGVVLALALHQVGDVQALRPGNVLNVLALGGVAAVLMLYWSLVHRSLPPEPWFLSHLLWLCLSFAFLLLVVAVGALVLVVGFLFLLLIPPLAPLVIYGPFLAAWLTGAWFAWRMGRGYLAFRRRQAIGLSAEYGRHLVARQTAPPPPDPTP